MLYIICTNSCEKLSLDQGRISLNIVPYGFHDTCMLIKLYMVISCAYLMRVKVKLSSWNKY